MSASPTNQSSTAGTTIEQRLARTLEIHAELMALWEVEADYDIELTVFPPQRLYLAVTGLEETSSKGVTVKHLETGPEWSRSKMITFHRPDSGGAS